MAVVARPDLIGAMLTRLRAIPEVAAQVSSSAGWTDGRSGSPRISGAVQDAWKMPTRSIRLRRTGGPIVGSDYSLSLWSSRVDVLCYGATVLEASALLDLVLPALCPPQGQSAGWTVNGCRVGSIEPEADAIATVEPDTQWPFAWAPLIVRWLGVPAA